jgi:hypothetical protein
VVEMIEWLENSYRNGKEHYYRTDMSWKEKLLREKFVELLKCWLK